VLNLFRGRSIVRRILDITEYLSNRNLVRKNREFTLNGAPDGFPVPPPFLVYLACNAFDVAEFYGNGRKCMDWITDLLARQNVEMDGIGSVLDFGCGCGRVLRFWADHPEVRVHGTDYNPRLIEWCRENLPFCTVSVNTMDAGLDYADSGFDLVYAISVFTHLPEGSQGFWLDELTRVTRTGGLVVLTAHGPSGTTALTAEQRTVFEGGGIVVKEGLYGGTNICRAFHPPGAFERLSDGRLLLLDHVENGATDVAQDVYLFRKI
jgi:SAM-dependent methyltransferase